MKHVKRLFAELRRRRVFRVAAMYAVVAWMLMQIGEVTFPALRLPDWTLTLVVVLLIGGFPIAMILAWAFDVTSAGVVRTDAADRPEQAVTRKSDAPGIEAADSLPALDPAGIAVLPFQNMSPDPDNEYFSDGIAEDLILRLCKTGGLRVISRTSAWQYKQTPAGARQIGSELGVAYLVEGSVRRIANNVRIAAQLIDVRSDQHIWAETYDRELEDIFAIQSDVAQRIAGALSVTLTGVESATGRESSITTDLEAYDLYLRGRYHWNRRTPKDLEECVVLFQGAIDRDPCCVPAHAALAEAYVTLAIYGLRPAADVLPLARAEAKEALRQEPGQASALSALACVHAIFDWEWDQAAAAFEQVIRDNPLYPTAPLWFAMNVHLPLGRFEEAVGQLERAATVDPLSPTVEASLGVVAFMRGDFAEAYSRFEAVTARDNRLAFAHYYQGLSAQYMGDAGQALEALDRARAAGGWSAENQAALGGALAAAGREAEARDVLAAMTEGRENHYVSPVRIAQLHAALGENESALDRLDEAVEVRAADLIWVDVFPAFKAVRQLPRYEVIRARVFDTQ
ncbi:MAG: hypothetical protein OEM96_02470 [Gemmatimonadota bacterium]|nr:hypothetical protein [Gemmatimonadota bacterium]